MASGAPTARAGEARARCRIMGSKERRHCFQGLLDQFKALIPFLRNSPGPRMHSLGDSTRGPSSWLLTV